MSSTEPVVLYAIGEPVAQPRAKVNTFSRRGFTPDDAGKVASWKARVQGAFLGATPALRSRLREWAKRGDALMISMQVRLKRGPSVKRPHASVKPDWDNLAKAIQDALEDAGALGNDSRIVSASVLKRYARDGEQPGATIAIAPYTEGENAR